MSLIKPFRALRPAAGRSEDVVAPPYDVVDRAEAKALVAGRPWSFLHISRPEIDLDDGVDPYDASVYEKGRENLQRMLDEVAHRELADRLLGDWQLQLSHVTSPPSPMRTAALRSAQHM